MHNKRSTLIKLIWSFCLSIIFLTLELKILPFYSFIIYVCITLYFLLLPFHSFWDIRGDFNTISSETKELWNLSKQFWTKMLTIVMLCNALHVMLCNAKMLTRILKGRLHFCGLSSIKQQDHSHYYANRYLYI